MSRLSVAMASVVVAALVTVAAPAHAQGRGNGHQSHPPSSSALPSPTGAAPVTEGAAPFAWIDDASVLPPGAMVVSVSMTRWQGTDLSEVEAPIVGVAAGVAPRLQIGVSIPHVVADDVNGVAGGIDTTYLSAKFGVLTSKTSNVKLAVAPTIEILGAGALESLAPGTSRTQFGLPVSVEVGGPSLRMFASAGFFSQGVWYAGGGVGGTLTRRMAASVAFSRAWTTSPIGSAVGDRRDVSGTLAFSVRPQISVFGSVGTTVATTDQDGAGTTVTGGVVFLLWPGRP